MPTATPTPTATAKPTPAPRISLSKCTITVKDRVYTGKAHKPAPVVQYRDATLKKGRDYTVAYENNVAIGTAKVILTGKGKYTGTVKKSFKINPKAVKQSSLAAGEGTITVKWRKGRDITGYQVQCSLKKGFASPRTVTVSDAATTTAEIRKLKPSTTYYVRIRAYRKVKSKKYYSAWSKVGSVMVE